MQHVSKSIIENNINFFMQNSIQYKLRCGAIGLIRKTAKFTEVFVFGTAIIAKRFAPAAASGRGESRFQLASCYCAAAGVSVGDSLGKICLSLF
jgi:hypothetical protein